MYVDGKQLILSD